MISRLGQVIYWSGNGIAAICAIGAALSVVGDMTPTGHTVTLVVFAVVASISWLIGRACRYVFAGY